MRENAAGASVAGPTEVVRVPALPTAGIRNDFLIRPFVFPRALTPAQCDALLAMTAASPLRPGRLVEDVPGYRVCRVANLPRDDESEWAFQRIFELLQIVNAAWYQFDTNEQIESIQLVRYDVGGQINWHTDCGPGETSTRKLSLTIQLSAQDAYAGGSLEFMPGGEPSACRAQGTAIAFPAYLTHRVAPVTSGTRYALVTWLHGPAFR